MSFFGQNFLTLLLVSQVLSSAKFTISDDMNHCCSGMCGQCQRIHIGDDVCINLVELNNKVSSINTHDTCVKVWDGANCNGSFKIIKPGSDCDHWNLDGCDWGDTITSISDCSYNPKKIFSTPSNNGNVDPKVECPNGAWVKQIHVKANSAHALELDCSPPGEPVPFQKLQAAHGVTALKDVSTRCDVMRGISLDLGSGGIRGNCEYDEDFSSYDASPFTSLCANLDSAVCGIHLVISQAGNISGGMPICCNVPNPGTTCTPTDRLQLLKHCDNSQGTTPLDCRFEKFVGIAMEKSKEVSFFSKLYTADQPGTFWRTLRKGDAQTPILAVSYYLLHNFGELGQSNRTGYEWSQRANAEWIAAATQLATITFTTESLTISPGQNIKVEQVVGECGPFILYTEKTVVFKVSVDESGAVSTRRLDDANSESNSSSSTTWILLALILILGVTLVLVLIFGKFRAGKPKGPVLKVFNKIRNGDEDPSETDSNVLSTSTYQQL